MNDLYDVHYTPFLLQSPQLHFFNDTTTYCAAVKLYMWACAVRCALQILTAPNGIALLEVQYYGRSTYRIFFVDIPAVVKTVTFSVTSGNVDLKYINLFRGACDDPTKSGMYTYYI